MSKGPEGFHPKREQTPAIKPTEIVLDDFDRAHDDCRGHASTDEEKLDAFNVLHEKLEHFENQEMTRLYDEGRVPTFQSLDLATDIARTALEKAGDPEADRIAKLLSERVRLVKQWSRRYVGSILRYRRSELARMRMNENEQRQEFFEADKDRRRIHDALLQTIGSMNELLKAGEEYAAYDRPAEWVPGIPLPEGTAWEQAAIFSEKAIADRDLIRDWAIVADRVEEIKKLTGYPPAPKK